jgi:hypothetical protein
MNQVGAGRGLITHRTVDAALTGFMNKVMKTKWNNAHQKTQVCWNAGLLQVVISAFQHLSMYIFQC